MEDDFCGLSLTLVPRSTGPTENVFHFSGPAMLVLTEELVEKVRRFVNCLYHDVQSQGRDLK